MIYEEEKESKYDDEYDLDEQSYMEETIHEFYKGCKDKGFCNMCEHFEKCYAIAESNRRNNMLTDMYIYENDINDMDIFEGNY